mmetsp:Transcript_60312/g.174064  ORF Transcript_60312/g.174064 Transcript_60312/m.174064 type:complete len:232 (-) Transcript_60312:12-707(-)
MPCGVVAKASRDHVVIVSGAWTPRDTPPAALTAASVHSHVSGKNFLTATPRPAAPPDASLSSMAPSAATPARAAPSALRATGIISMSSMSPPLLQPPWIGLGQPFPKLGPQEESTSSGAVCELAPAFASKASSGPNSATTATSGPWMWQDCQALGATAGASTAPRSSASSTALEEIAGRGPRSSADRSREAKKTCAEALAASSTSNCSPGRTSEREKDADKENGQVNFREN